MKAAKLPKGQMDQKQKNCSDTQSGRHWWTALWVSWETSLLFISWLCGRIKLQNNEGNKMQLFFFFFSFRDAGSEPSALVMLVLYHWPALPTFLNTLLMVGVTEWKKKNRDSIEEMFLLCCYCFCLLPWFWCSWVICV